MRRNVIDLVLSILSVYATAHIPTPANGNAKPRLHLVPDNCPVP